MLSKSDCFQIKRFDYYSNCKCLELYKMLNFNLVYNYFGEHFKKVKYSYLYKVLKNRKDKKWDLLKLIN